MLFKNIKSIFGSVLILGVAFSPLNFSVRSAQAEDLVDFEFDFNEEKVKSELPSEDTEQSVVNASPDNTGSTSVLDDTAIASPDEDSLLSAYDNSDIANTSGSQPIPHSGQYYDADSLVPKSELRGKAGMREVDPKYEPGSRFVVVRKGSSQNSEHAQIIAAQRALKLGRYTSAMELYEQLYKKNPRNQQVLMGLAVSQQYSGFKESAITTYEELLKINPNNTEATVNMLGLFQSEYPAVAYRKLQDLWNGNNKNPAIAAQLGLTSASVGNIDEAMKYLGIAASIEPKNASHYYNMGVVADQAGAFKDARDFYEKALEIDVSYGGGRSIPRDQVYDRLATLRRM